MDEDIYGFINNLLGSKNDAKLYMYDSIISTSTLHEGHLDNVNKLFVIHLHFILDIQTPIHRRGRLLVNRETSYYLTREITIIP